MTKEMVQRNPRFKRSGLGVYDPIRSWYHMWCPEAKFSFLVKLRPFCKEFLEEAMNNYKIYFYTAAQSGYAKKVLEILKLEMNSNSKLVDQTFNPSRLITRDDKHKYN